jgi:small-conductance mechanosensitive channel
MQHTVVANSPLPACPRQRVIAAMGHRATWIGLAVTAAIIIALTVAAAFVLKRLVATLAHRRQAQPEVWKRIDACRSPSMAVLFLILVRTYGAVLEAVLHGNRWIGLLLSLLLLLSFGWLASRGAAVLIALLAVRFNRSAADDPQRMSRIRTQLGVFQRVASMLIWLATVIFALLNFPSTRPLATSLFASASLLGLVIGLAAQSTLANMIAGLQIAFGDAVRIDDTVGVNGHHGVVEEISLTYIVIRMADNRRMIVPVTDFVRQPFENWTRKSPALRVDSYLFVDHSAPLPLLRDRFRMILAESGYWDGEEGALAIAESDRDCLKLKLSMSAASPHQATLLGEHVLEQLTTFLVRELPAALPHHPVSALASSRRGEHAHLHRRSVELSELPEMDDSGSD